MIPTNQIWKKRFYALLIIVILIAGLIIANIIYLRIQEGRMENKVRKQIAIEQTSTKNILFWNGTEIVEREILDCLE